MRFTLEIELGNDAMCSGRDVAGALRRAAYEVGVHGLVLSPADAVSVGIRDANGNSVGRWEVVAPVPPANLVMELAHAMIEAGAPQGRSWRVAGRLVDEGWARGRRS